ncbi:MAG: hypothetical protein AB9842_08255 [Bacteroidales bacterium]
MKKKMKAVLLFLGIAAFHEKEGKKMLTPEQRQNMAEAFGEDFTAQFEEDLKKEGLEEGTGIQNAELAQAQADLTQAQTDLETMKREKTATEAELSSLKQTITQLQAQVKILSDLPVADAKIEKVDKTLEDVKNDKFLFGVNVPFMAIDENHPYNRRAFAALMASKEGMEYPTPKYSQLDYESLKDDLGDFYRIRKQERIQSFLVKLPSLEKIFPLESGYQDRAVLVNMFLNEFSQADNTSSSFDNVIKGGYKFEPEELRMFDVMFAYKFTDLKKLEKTWIGYLNKEGSNSMKWSFIEFIMVETGKKLHNEREVRRINGRRINPVLNEAGTALGASDGLREFLKKQIDLFKIRPFSLGEWTETTISEHVRLGTSMVPSALRDTGSVVLYMSPDAVSAYHKNNELLYGLNQDYKADLMYVKEYPSVKIVAIPNMAESKRMIWTLEGNISLFEDEANEMYKFYFEQQDWSLKVWSNWKESIWAYMVGKKFDSLEEIPEDYSTQMIFCNDIDYPSTYFLQMGLDDATPSVSVHNCLVTQDSEDGFAITGIDDCAVGQEVKIKCGITDTVSINNAGVFSLLSAPWEPEAGDVITLRKRADGKFIEINRETAISRIPMFEADDTYPSVEDYAAFVANPANDGVTITSLDDAVVNKEYTLYGIDAGDNDGTALDTVGGNFVLTGAYEFGSGTWIKLVKSGVDGKFYETSRSGV